MRPPLVWIPQHFGCLIFDRRSSRYLPFDREAAEFLRAAMATDVWSLIGARGQDPGLINFVEAFEERGFWRVDGRLAGVALAPARVPEGHLLGPLATHVEIIAACNLTCTHCFAGELPRKTSLSLAELDDLFGQLAALGSFRLGLTGGEPLLRKDLFEILDAATGHGLHPCLTTNALLIDERIARELGRRELVWLNVSLEGATARTNDRVRGLGSFSQVVERLRILADHARFTLAFTITEQNADEVEACAELAARLGAHTAVFRPLYPVGVARHRPEMMPSFSRYSDALARLSGISLGDDIHAIDPFSPQARERTAARVHANPGCGAGNLVASISAAGDVNPCSFLGPKFEAGNVRERPFADIWNDSQIFQRMRASKGEFAGGCRARSLAFSGSADAADPWQVEWERLLLSARELPPRPNSNLERGLA